MDRTELERWITQLHSTHPGNVVSAEAALSPELAGLTLYDPPIFGTGAASDPLFEALKQPEAVGPWHKTPAEWLPGAKTVISMFFPFTEAVRRSNRADKEIPSLPWLHGRIEGQAYLSALLGQLTAHLQAAGFDACAPAIDPRFGVVRGGAGLGQAGLSPAVFGANWSERHAAYICSLGTFGLSRGLITKRGMAGRFASVITTLDLPPEKRPYTGLYDHCIFCGACVRRCPVGAISMETGKSHVVCAPKVGAISQVYPTHYGCGKCQVGVPCETGIPKRRAED